MVLIPSFRAISLMAVRPIYGVVDGVDQRPVWKDENLEIAHATNVLITSSRIVKVVNPDKKDAGIEVSAVMVINMGKNLYYQAAAFQRAFGEDRVYKLVF